MKVVLKMMFGGMLASALVAGAPQGPPAPVAAGTYATVSGRIAQLNYDRDAQVEGFLLNDHTLVHLPPPVAPRMAMSLKAGDTVQVAGYSRMSVSGFQSIEAQQIQDRTSGGAITVPTPGAAAPFSESGRIRQLNYDADGAVDGFLLDNGTFVTMPPYSASNPSSIRAGGSTAFSGYARRTLDGRTVVDVQTLSVNGQTLNVAVAGPVGGPDAPPRPRRMRRNAPPPPPDMAGPPAGPVPAGAPPPPPNSAGPNAAPPAASTPAGTAEPPPPPAPPQL